MSKEIILASEKVQRQNLVAVRDYTTETRKIVRKLEEENEHLRKEVMSLKEELTTLNGKLTQIQIKLWQLA